MPNIIKVPLLILYCSVISRAAVWSKTGAWPTFTPETLVSYPPRSGFEVVNAIFLFLWNLPIELWFIGPAVLLLLLNAVNRDGTSSLPA